MNIVHEFLKSTVPVLHFPYQFGDNNDQSGLVSRHKVVEQFYFVSENTKHVVDILVNLERRSPGLNKIIDENDISRRFSTNIVEQEKLFTKALMQPLADLFKDDESQNFEAPAFLNQDFRI